MCRIASPSIAGSIGGHFEGKTAAGRSPKGVLLLHDNAPAHRPLATQKKLAYLCFQCLDHPPYSPDLAPSDYHLFPGLKKQMNGRHVSSDAEVIADSETFRNFF
jgi:histone-lysine N-methyltransferase SETMAR